MVSEFRAFLPSNEIPLGWLARVCVIDAVAGAAGLLSRSFWCSEQTMSGAIVIRRLVPLFGCVNRFGGEVNPYHHGLAYFARIGCALGADCPQAGLGRNRCTLASMTKDADIGNFSLTHLLDGLVRQRQRLNGSADLFGRVSRPNWQGSA